jgi:hypothetical protein
LANRTQRAKVATRLVGTFHRRRQQHQSDDAGCAAGGCHVEHGSERFFSNAVLGRFPGQIHLDEQFEPPVRAERRRVESAHERRIVDRVDRVEMGACFARFVRL